MPLPFLLDLNAGVLLPDLAVILTAPPSLVSKRIAERGVRHRFHLDPTMPAREADLYTAAAQTFMTKHVKVLILDTSDATQSEVAARIADAIPALPVASVATLPPTTSQGP